MLTMQLGKRKLETQIDMEKAIDLAAVGGDGPEAFYSESKSAIEKEIKRPLTAEEAKMLHLKMVSRY